MTGAREALEVPAAVGGEPPGLPAVGPEGSALASRSKEAAATSPSAPARHARLDIASAGCGAGPRRTSSRRLILLRSSGRVAVEAREPALRVRPATRVTGAIERHSDQLGHGGRDLFDHEL